MKTIFQFRGTLFAAIVAFTAAYFWGGTAGVFTAIVLSLLEISLSVDNAVLNAKQIGAMSRLWQRRYLTWGMFIAVFGMRLVFPILIASLSAKLPPWEILILAFNQPEEYARFLTAAGPTISAFGGMFLLMVFLKFFLDKEKDIHWIHVVERWLTRFGRLESSEIIIALLALLSAIYFLPGDLPEGAKLLSVFTGGVLGLFTYLVVDSLTGYFEKKNNVKNALLTNGIKTAGAATFFYVEMRDASFSFDGVIGAFAITNDIVLITLGLGVGALFLRTFTLALVKGRTLEAYKYLEHGAHYAIGVLAIIMLLGTKIHVPETVTGTLGLLIIAVSVFSSVRRK